MITASALKAHCAYAKVLGGKRTPTPDQQRAMDRGTEFGAHVEAWVKTGVFPVVEDAEIQGWVDLLAAQWVPPPGTRAEVPWGLLSDGSYVEVEEPLPHVYVATSGSADRWLLTAGRADLTWVERDTLYVPDLKAGRWPVTPAVDNLQVNGAGLALAQAAGVGGYVPAIYYARDGAWDIGERVERGSDDWERAWNAVREAAALPLEPLPGPWCGSCWERLACPRAEAPMVSP